MILGSTKRIALGLGLAGFAILMTSQVAVTRAETETMNTGTYQQVGCGTREIMTIDVYRVELAARTSHSPTMVAMRDETTPVRLRIQVSSDISLPDEPPTSWVTRLEPKLSNEDMTEFDAIFSRVDAGDVMTVVFSPARGTRILLNKKQVLHRDGKGLMHALVALWIGENPLSDSLKEDILDPDEDCIFD